MIKLQFKDCSGHKTLVTFWKGGFVTVQAKNEVTKYTKDSPIAEMYQNLLHSSREVGPNLFQVVGAW